MSSVGKLQEPSMDDIIRSIRSIIADEAMTVAAPVAAKPEPKQPTPTPTPVYKLSEQQIAVAATAAPVASPRLSDRLSAAGEPKAPRSDTTPVAARGSAIDRIAGLSGDGNRGVAEDDLDLSFGSVAAANGNEADGLDVFAAPASPAVAAASATAAEIETDPFADIATDGDDLDSHRYGANGVDPLSIRDEADAFAPLGGTSMAVDDVGFDDEPEGADTAEVARRIAALDGIVSKTEANAAPRNAGSLATDASGETDMFGAAASDEPLSLAAVAAAPEPAPVAVAIAAVPTQVAAQAVEAARPAVRGEDAAAATAVASATSQALAGIAPSIPAAAAQPAAGGSRTFEESVREMLRPMIRDWLDANMPRIIERAIMEEIDKK